MYYRPLALIIFGTVILGMFGCTPRPTVKDGPPHHFVDVSKIPNVTPRKLPKSRYGNPKTYTINGKHYHVLNTAKGYDERGIASWYGTKFQGHLTSSREPYNMFAMTGASPVLPIPSFVRVTNLENKKSIIVKINDRGPFAPNRIIDLSYAAAKKLGYALKGTALVEVTALNIARPKTALPHKPKLYLQLGAFRLLSHAKNLRTKVATIIHKNIIIKKSIYRHFPIYKVRIGPLIGVGESDRLHERLKKLGFESPITIVS